MLEDQERTALLTSIVVAVIWMSAIASLLYLGKEGCKP